MSGEFKPDQFVPAARIQELENQITKLIHDLNKVCASDIAFKLETTKIWFVLGEGRQTCPANRSPPAEVQQPTLQRLKWCSESLKSCACVWALPLFFHSLCGNVSKVQSLVLIITSFNSFLLIVDSRSSWFVFYGYAMYITVYRQLYIHTSRQMNISQ